jgi:hypothetical protein
LKIPQNSDKFLLALPKNYDIIAMGIPPRRGIGHDLCLLFGQFRIKRKIERKSIFQQIRIDEDGKRQKDLQRRKKGVRVLFKVDGGRRITE